jgi:hypothetical protein
LFYLYCIWKEYFKYREKKEHIFYETVKIDKNTKVLLHHSFIRTSNFTLNLKQSADCSLRTKWEDVWKSFLIVPGKTRTKDKYRVVYTDHQRVELEKEFYYSRYITIRRKAELATNLGLSERQVKIWFQNRRAKERKQVKKREEFNHNKDNTMSMGHITQQQILHNNQTQIGQGIIPPQLMWPGGSSSYFEWKEDNLQCLWWHSVVVVVVFFILFILFLRMFNTSVSPWRFCCAPLF